MKNGNHGTEVAAIHSEPFFSMTRRETTVLYQALLRSMFPDKEVRALVSRMGEALKGGR